MVVMCYIKVKNRRNWTLPAPAKQNRGNKKKSNQDTKNKAIANG